MYGAKIQNMPFNSHNNELHNWNLNTNHTVVTRLVIVTATTFVQIFEL